MIGRKPNVLIVDDDPILRRVLEQTLSRAGFGAAAADSGATALKMTSERVFDVVLSDLAMPKMTGIELLTALRGAGSSASFIVISSYSSKDNILTALRQGAFDFIAKPFHPSAIGKLLDEATRVHQRVVALTAAGASPAIARLLALVPTFGTADASGLDERSRNVLAAEGDAARFRAGAALVLSPCRSSIESLRNFQDRPWELGNLLRVHHALRLATEAGGLDDFKEPLATLEDFYANVRVRPEELATDMIVSLGIAHEQLTAAVAASAVPQALTATAQTVAKLEQRLAKALARAS